MFDLSPVFSAHAMVKESLAVWSQNRWQYFSIDYIEPLPAGSQTIVNFGAVTANNNTAQTELTTFDVDEHQLLQVRMYPLDDVEVVLWLTRSQGKFSTRGVQARVSHASRSFDPYLETSEFNILGRDRNAFIQIYNNGGYNIAQSRVQFWVRKYVLIPLQNVFEAPDNAGVLRPFVRDPQGNMNRLVCEYIDAEGRLA